MHNGLQKGSTFRERQTCYRFSLVIALSERWSCIFIGETLQSPLQTQQVDSLFEYFSSCYITGHYKLQKCTVYSQVKLHPERTEETWILMETAMFSTVLCKFIIILLQPYVTWDWITRMVSWEFDQFQCQCRGAHSVCSRKSFVLCRGWWYSTLVWASGERCKPQ